MVSCCNEEQTAFGILYLVYLTLALVAWDSILVKPMRLMATLVRDMSLAIMCWLSCGRVRNNEVRDTKFRGGFKYLITMGSYLGEAFWGMMFTIMSGGRRTATWAAGGLCVALISALFYIPNRKRVILNMCYCILIVTLIAIEWFIFTPILAYVVLFFGVFLSTYALADIYGVAIQPLRVGSDAYVLHEESGRWCHPKCIGVQWFLVALFMQLVGIWLALALISEECDALRWGECVLSGELFDWQWNWNWDNC